jgi:hypothetical protein
MQLFEGDNLEVGILKDVKYGRRHYNVAAPNKDALSDVIS